MRLGGKSREWRLLGGSDDVLAVISGFKKFLFTPLALFQRKSRDWVLADGLEGAKVLHIRAEAVPSTPGAEFRVTYQLELPPLAEESAELMLSIPRSPLRCKKATLAGGPTSIQGEFPLGEAGGLLSFPIPEGLTNEGRTRLSFQTEILEWSYFRTKPGLLHFPRMIPDIARVQAGGPLPGVDIEAGSAGLRVVAEIAVTQEQPLAVVVAESEEVGRALDCLDCGLGFSTSSEARKALSAQFIATLQEEISNCVSYLADLFAWRPLGAICVALLGDRSTSRDWAFRECPDGLVVGLTPTQVDLLQKGRLQGELARQLSGLWWGGAVRLAGPEKKEIRTAIQFAAGVRWLEAIGAQEEAGATWKQIRELGSVRIQDGLTIAASGHSLRRLSQLSHQAYGLLIDDSRLRRVRGLHEEGRGTWLSSVKLADLLDEVDLVNGVAL